MYPFDPPAHPAWFGKLVAEVAHAFETTGADTPGWPDPHPDRDPAEDEYSRCLDPAKYRILDARLDAWTDVLARDIARVDELTSGAWLDAPRRPDDHARVRRVAPVVPGGLTLVVANTVVDGEPFGLDLGITGDGMSIAFLDTLPDCGCDACDSGSADLLATLDGWVLTVARGGVVHARSAGASITRTIDGWQSTGGGELLQSWLDLSSPAPPGVARWAGTPWV